MADFRSLLSSYFSKLLRQFLPTLSRRLYPNGTVYSEDTIEPLITKDLRIMDSSAEYDELESLMQELTI